MASTPRVVCDYGNHTGEGAVRHPDEGIPDGMTVDEDGGLWSAAPTTRRRTSRRRSPGVRLSVIPSR